MIRRHLLFWPVLAAYLLLGLLYAVYTPDWQAPDEPAHYNYVSQLADGELPVMEPSDYDQEYIEDIVSSRFDPAYDPGRLTYEDWQPPLYYLLGTPVYEAGRGSLEALRAVSVLLGAVVVSLAYLVGLRLFPEQPWVGLGTAVFVAFIPQHLAMLGSVNNDSLSELLVAAILLLLVSPWPEGDTRRLVGMGIVLGLGFLTKGSVYVMAPVIGLFLLIRFWGRWGELVRAGLLVFLPALLLGAVWWARNALLYGNFDILARQVHDRVAVGQLRTSELAAQVGTAQVVWLFVAESFRSFWGQFGWMAAPLPGWAYTLLKLLTLAVVLGLAVLGWRWLRGRDFAALYPGTTLDLAGFAALVATFLLTFALLAGYNLTFVQHQGRYLFPALVPIGLGAVLGLGEWLRPFIPRLSRAGYLVPLGLAALLVPLALFSLFRIVVPALSLP